MGVKAGLKNSMSGAHFFWRLPVYWNLFQSQRFRWKLQLPYDVIRFDRRTIIRGPDLTLGHEIFEAMSFEVAGRREAHAFLRLAKGCSKFVDLGASGGFFSALFAASRNSYQIVSVEPDPEAFGALLSTKQKNNHGLGIWSCDDRGVAAEAGKRTVNKESYSLSIAPNENHAASKSGFEIRTAALSEICAEHDIQPDLIKFDIESMEYEVILQSEDWLRTLRPRLHLELHSPILRSRGLNGKVVLEHLYKIGYRLFTAHTQDLTHIIQKSPPDKITRLDLLIP